MEGILALYTATFIFVIVSTVIIDMKENTSYEVVDTIDFNESYGMLDDLQGNALYDIVSNEGTGIDDSEVEGINGIIKPNEAYGIFLNGVGMVESSSEAITSNKTGADQLSACIETSSSTSIVESSVSRDSFDVEGIQVTPNESYAHNTAPLAVPGSCRVTEW